MGMRGGAGVKVWTGTAKEFLEDGRFKIMDESDVVIVEGRAVMKSAVRKAMREGRGWREACDTTTYALAVWEEREL